MSKVEKKFQKNMEKSKVNVVKEDSSKNQILNFLKIICGILVIAIAVGMVSNFLSGNNKKKEEPNEADYSTILAGQTFTRNDKEYYVVFYDKEDILEKIDKVKNKNIYKVDLSSSLNKSILSENGNSKANDAESLKINGTTLIKIEDNKNVLYIEGYDKVVDYLAKL